MKNLIKLALSMTLAITAAAQTPTAGLAGPVATPSTPGSVKPNSSTMTVASDGTISPINNSSAPQYIAPQALAGCGVEYVSGLTYTVGACTYVINGQQLGPSTLQNITLAAADPSNPRIDAIFIDASGVVQQLNGTPASSPQQPVVDPSTQLQLTFVLVPTSATTPANTTLVDIYLEGSEWTGATGGTSSANVNLTSTNNPYSGTHDTEFGTSGTVTTTTFSSYTDPSSGTVNLSNYNALVFYMRNKAAWPSTRSVTVQWFSGSTAKGTPVVLSNGAFGWNATTNTTTYQQVSIPVATFGLAGVPVGTLRFTVTGTGAALTGFYLDQVTLQGGNGGVVLPTTLMNFKGPWSATATYNPNDTVTSGGVGYVALASSTNQAVSVTLFWAPLSTAGTVTSSSLTTNVVPKATGAGALGNSSITDNGTTVTSTDTGGWVGASYTSNGSTAGFVDYAAGSTSASVAPCNTSASWCVQAPTTLSSNFIETLPTPATGVILHTLSGSTITDTIVTPYVKPTVAAISSATGGSGTGTVTCLTAACTNISGTYSVAGGTFTTGTFLTLVWPTTTTAYNCWVSQNGGIATYGMGHGVATATGMTVTAGISIIGVTVSFDYGCSSL